MRTDGTELAQIFSEARALAADAGQPFSSAHLLLAFFTRPNPADLLLRERGVDEDAVLSRVRELPREDERVATHLVEQARDVARGVNSREPGALHLLVAITRARGSAAREMLTRAGASPADLAREALACVVGPLPRRFTPKHARPEPNPRPMAFATVPPRSRAATAAPSARQTSVKPAMSPTAPVRPASAPPAPPQEAKKASRLSAVRRLAEGLVPDDDLSPWALDPDEFPYLASLGRNLTELAASGRIDPVVGRDREIDEALDVLGKRRSNNPVLVGEPGVGKTAVAEGIAQRLVDAEEKRILVELDVGNVVAGTQLRGALSEKLNGIKEEVRRAAGRVVVFVDELHMLVGAGQTGEGSQDAAGELKAALARGEFPCIGATTFTEFHRYIAPDPALERRFVPIRVDEPTVPQAVEILRGIASRYEEHHGVTFSEEALQAAATMTARYLRDRCLPDKAITAVDHAGSRVRREGRERVERTDVARVVARMAGLPEERLLVTDADRILGVEEALARRVIGHSEVVSRVSAAVRRSFAGFTGGRPLASFIFLGPTGVGKTELARALSDVLFGPDALVRVDMSEFTESHSVARLLGAPPGYVGFGEGGQLTEAVRRRPASVVLFDEFEKAHRDAQQVLLQILDEGQVTDGRGRRVDFTSTVVVLTSNLGAEAFFERRERTVGFGATDGDGPLSSGERALSLARAAFAPELWNRIEERLVFHPLGREDLRTIARLLVERSSERLGEEKRIRFELDDTAIDHLLDHGGYDSGLGARPLRQTFARLIEGPLAEKILRGEILPPDRLAVTARGGTLHFEQLTILESRTASA